MSKRIVITAAAILAACGGVATTADNSAEAADQGKKAGAEEAGKQRALQRMREMQGFDDGGMAGCFDPKLSGRERAVAERLGGKPCEDESARAPTAGARASGTSASGFAGHWEGQFDGGEGSATISQVAEGRNAYAIDLEVAGREGCGGSVHGTGSVRGNSLAMVKADTGEQCKVTFTRRGQSLVSQESDCSYFHGMSCGFSGTARFKHATDTLEPSGHSE